MLALRDNICCYRRCDLETDCEILWCEVHLNPCSTYFIGVYYRSPSSDMAYLTKLVQSLEKFPPSSNILSLGEFNLPNVNWNLVALGLNVTKVHGPDGISARMIREAAPAISGSLTNLFNFSLQPGTLPMEWKSAHVIPILNKC